MNGERNCGSGSVLFSFLLGGIFGAALSMLLTPMSGPEVRRRIHDFGDDIKDRADDFAHEARDRVSSSIDKGKEYLDEKKSILSAAVEAGKEAYEREKHKPKQGGEE